MSHIPSPEEQSLLRPYLSTPEGCGQARALFEGCFNGVDVRSANVLKSLHGETPDAADFLHRMCYLSARELRSRKGCGHKTFHEISTRLDRFRQHLSQHLSQQLGQHQDLHQHLSVIPSASLVIPSEAKESIPSAAPEPE